MNHGPSIHHLQLVKLGEGKSFNDLLTALKAGGPPPKWLTMEGGPNPPELGDTASATVMLEPGNYAMLCFVPGPDGIPHIAKGMVRPLTVTAGTGGRATEPTADVVMKLTDYDFQLSKPITAGGTRSRSRMPAPRSTRWSSSSWDAGKQPMDFAIWGEKQVGKAPGTLHGGDQRDHAGGQGVRGGGAGGGGVRVDLFRAGSEGREGALRAWDGEEVEGGCPTLGSARTSSIQDEPCPVEGMPTARLQQQ